MLILEEPGLILIIAPTSVGEKVFKISSLRVGDFAAAALL